MRICFKFGGAAMRYYNLFLHAAMARVVTAAKTIQNDYSLEPFIVELRKLDLLQLVKDLEIGLSDVEEIIQRMDDNGNLYTPEWVNVLSNLSNKQINTLPIYQRLYLLEAKRVLDAIQKAKVPEAIPTLRDILAFGFVRDVKSRHDRELIKDVADYLNRANGKQFSAMAKVLFDKKGAIPNKPRTFTEFFNKLSSAVGGTHTEYRPNKVKKEIEQVKELFHYLDN